MSFTKLFRNSINLGLLVACLVVGKLISILSPFLFHIFHQVADPHTTKLSLYEWVLYMSSTSRSSLNPLLCIFLKVNTFKLTREVHTQKYLPIFFLSRCRVKISLKLCCIIVTNLQGSYTLEVKVSYFQHGM